MRRARKTDPALAAELRAKSRSVSQIPADSLVANSNAPAALVLTNSVLSNLQEKWTGPALAQTRVARTGAAQACLTQTHVAQACHAQTCLARTRLARTLAIRTKTPKWESLNPSLRLSLSRKPRRPNLHRLPLRIPRATAPPRIHQQIPEPPRSAPIPQPHPQKPNLIPSPHRRRAEQLVKRLHTLRRITPARLAQTYSERAILSGLLPAS